MSSTTCSDKIISEQTKSHGAILCHSDFFQSETLKDSNEVSKKEPLFATDLFKSISIEGNLVFSPYSIKSCLGLAYMGAAGETAAEFAKALHFGEKTKDEISSSFSKDLQRSDVFNLISIANKIFLPQSNELSDSFIKLSKRAFDSGAECMGFDDSEGTEKTINDWVEKETNGKFKDFLPPGTIDGDTNILLVNAIYFKGKWDIPFPHENTQRMEFHPASGEPVHVEFMNYRDSFMYGSIDDLEASAIEMKYKDGGFSMVILLPNHPVGLAEMTEKIQDNYDLMAVSDKLSALVVDIYIPKFEIEYELDLDSPLRSLGMISMFEDEADFSELFQGDVPSMKISKAVHKAMNKVDEDGSEAEVATFLKSCCTSDSSDQITFMADYPFMWYIKDKSDIYFMGLLTEIRPSNQEEIPIVEDNI